MLIKFLLLSAGVLNSILGITIIFGDKEKKERFLFAFLAIATAGWSFAVFFIHQNPNSIFVRLSYSFGVLIAAAFLNWVYYYSSWNKRKLYSLITPILTSILGLIFFILPLFTDLVIFEVQMDPFGNLQEQRGSLYPAYVGYFLFSYSYTLIKLLNLYRRGDSITRKQLGLVLVGFSFFGGYSILLGLVLPLFGFDLLIDSDVPISIIFTAFVFVSIVHYKWMNIKIIAAQTLTSLIWILLAYQFLWSSNYSSKVVSIITFSLSFVFGLMLIKSVRNEVQRKEELENLSSQLSTANDKLHQLDKAKSEFISIASHQLRTPLTSIKGFGSLLLEGTYGEVSQTQRNALEKIYIANERLIQLVEDLLNVSRIDAGRMEFDFQDLNIENLIDEAVSTLELSAKAKSLYLHWEKPSSPMPKVRIDATKIKEVISNMIDNAIKYTQKGGITVRVEKNTVWSSDHKEYQRWLRFIVSDTGMGMDKEDINMIFEKFQRGKQSAHYHTDGTGLGMYIGKKIVAEHKGRIWAESEGKGKGSRFILELPVN